MTSCTTETEAVRQNTESWTVRLL